jgi:hypothetical protein
MATILFRNSKNYVKETIEAAAVGHIIVTISA